MSVDREAAREAIAEKRRLSAVPPPGPREASAEDLRRRVVVGNAAYTLRADPNWTWYAGVLAETLGQAEEDLQRWLDADATVSPMEFNEAVLAYQKSMRALARERVTILRWASKLVDNAIQDRDKAQAVLERLSDIPISPIGENS